MEDMAPLTLQSIYIGAISGLITYD
ncbi:hypothetical protein [Mucilaginibacter antarcticus]